jgi:hypothetical protein
MFSHNKKVFVTYGKEIPIINKPNPNFSVMVWGAISRKGTMALKFVEGKLN